MPIQYKNYCELLLTCEDCKIRDIQNMEFLISGYPQYENNYAPTNVKGTTICLDQFGLQKQGRAASVDFKLGTIQYKISTLSGQSGCPVINQGNIIAIHLGGKANQVWNIGRLITFDVLQNIQKWAKELNANQFLVNLKSFCQHNTLQKLKDLNKEQNSFYLEQYLTIIQFLYSSEQFREKIKLSKANLYKSTLTYLLNNIFQLIAMDADLKTKQKWMKKLAIKIEQIDRLNKYYNDRHQDFIIVFNRILFQLFQQNQILNNSSNLQYLFFIQTQDRCQCGINQKSKISLTNCQRSIKATLQTENHLMIILNYNQKYNHVKPYRIYNNGGLVYQCIAKILYTEEGFYRTSRLCSKKQFIEFSDSHAYLEQSKYPFCLLYTLSKQNQIQRLFAGSLIVQQKLSEKLQKMLKEQQRQKLFEELEKMLKEQQKQKQKLFEESQKMFKQRLFLDGVNQLDYNNHKSLYEYCAECTVPFNTNNQLPYLLICGHVCCKQWLNQQALCGYCGKQKVVKIPQYKLLLPKNELLYDFHIRISLGQMSYHIHNKKSNVTIGQILTQFDGFVDFERYFKRLVNVVLNHKSYIYYKIKNKPISDFQNKLQPNKNRKSNVINIVDSKLGG